jgi:hypothetical protein
MRDCVVDDPVGTSSSTMAAIIVDQVDAEAGGATVTRVKQVLQ